MEGANGLYRIVFPMMAMEARGHEVVAVEQEYRKPLAIESLAGCDLVHLHRPVMLDDEGAAVARIREAGALVGFDEDDDIGAFPRELTQHPALAEMGAEWMPRATRNFEQLLAHAPRVDLLTTPNASLAAQFEALGADNVHVIENYLPGEYLRVEPRGHDGLVVGWHAGREHVLDADALGLRPTLVRMLDEHPDVHVVTINLDLAIEHERYHHEPVTSMDRLTARLADFDIGIVPLADIPFNRGRSNVKAREYAAAGVPWLASPVGPYEQLGRDQGGRLVEDDEWLAALDELVRSRRERRKLAKNAKAWAKRETIWRMADVWEQVFLDTIEDVRAAA